MKKLSLEKLLKILLSAFLFLLPWQTVYIFREVFLNGVKIEYWTLNFYGTEILLWLIVVLFMVWYWRESKVYKVEKPKVHITKDRIFVFSVLLFIIYHLSSVFWATDKSLALQQSVHMMEAVLLFFILFLGPLKFREAVKYLLLGSLAPAVLGIGQFLLQTTFAFKWLGLAQHVSSEPGTSVIVGEGVGRWLRAYGSFNHPNAFGGYIALVLVLSYITYHISHITFECSKSRCYVLYVTCYVIMTALFFTFSRTAWIVMFISLLVYWFTSSGRKKIIIYHLSFIIILLAMFFPLVQTRILGNSSHEVVSVSERVSGYGEALEIFKTSPWLGVGAGNYTTASYNLNPDLEPWQYQPVHNIGLLFLVELGIVGVLLLLLTIVLFVTYHISRITYKKELMVCYVLCVTGYVILASLDHYLYTSYVGLALSGVYWGMLSRDPHS